MSARLSAIAIAVSSALLLSACGGGGGGSASTATPSTLISGTAAAGSPIIGKVTIKDSLGAQKTVDIAADGKYTVDVAGMTGPLKRGELERARAWGERLARAAEA